MILTAGRHNYRKVNVGQYLQQALQQRGWFIWLVQLFASHPFMSYRIPALFNLGLMQNPQSPQDPQNEPTA